MSIPLFISILFFSIYDTECIVFDHASVVNCSHSFFISNPEHCVFAWLLLSSISTFLFILIVCRNYKALNYQLSKAKMIYKRGSFGSLIFLLLMSVIYYAIRIHTTKDTGTLSRFLSGTRLGELNFSFIKYNNNHNNNNNNEFIETYLKSSFTTSIYNKYDDKNLC